MTYAYNENFLNYAMQNLGDLFDYSINICNIPAEDFEFMFLNSKISHKFSVGVPNIIVGKTGIELAQELTEPHGMFVEYKPDPKKDFSRSAEYWAGWILAYVQWKTSFEFDYIFKHVPLKEIIERYHPLHEASEDKAFDVLFELIKTRQTETQLKTLRRLHKYSQAFLSEKSGVSLRAIQQYEQRAKNINKASSDTLFALSKTLNCKMEDLLE